MSQFSPKAFLDVATVILQQDPPAAENFLRTAVGRAYYAAHLFARENLLQRRRISRDRKGKARHGAVIKALNIPATQLAANALDQLMLLRAQADYDLESAVSRPSAEESTRLALLVIGELEMVK